MSEIKVVQNWFDDPEAQLELFHSLRLQDVFDGQNWFRNIAIDLRESVLIKDLAMPPFFRQYDKGQETPTFIHSDVREGDTTTIVYLNKENIDNGIAFWQHVDGSIRATKENVDKYLEDSHNESKWKLIREIPVDFNTAVIFDSDLFHSRYPKDAWDVGEEESRLIKVYFKRREEKQDEKINLRSENNVTPIRSRLSG